jgi:hypothetical protein
MNKCPLCNGNGRKCVPVKNIHKIKVKVHDCRGNPVWVIPKYTTIIEKCECVQAKQEKNGTN